MAKMDIDKKLIRELAELLKETDLTEIEVSDESHQIRVARASNTVVQAAAPAVAVATIPALESAPAAAPAEDDLSKHPGAVTSPMVGTVYVSAEPGAPPFVKLGDTVSEGQTLLLVEAMKTMNPIVAPRAGKIARSLIVDSQPVEFGEILLIIE